MRAPRPGADDRGQVLPMVAIVLTALMLFASMAIDLGYQRVVRRDMQALADVVSLDMARLLDGRSVFLIEGDPTWSATLAASVARNDTNAGNTPTVTASAGTLDSATGVFTDGAATTIPNAVRVQASNTVSWFFRPGSGSVTRSSIATSNPDACFRLGSFALAVNSGNSAVLNGLIGDALNLGVLGYSGLATSSVSLGALTLELGVGTVDELVALDNLSVRDFYLAVADVMSNNGDTVNATLLRNIGLSMGGAANFDVSDILNIATGSGAAATAGFNVLDLIAGAAFVSNGSSALAIPNLAANLGLTSFTSSINVIQSPQTACGRVDSPTVAQTDQLSVDVNGNLLSVPNFLGLLTATAAVDLDLDLADAVGTLTQVVCGDATVADPEGVTVDVLTALSQLTLNMPIHVSGQLSLNLLGLGLSLVNVTLDINASAGTTAPQTASQADIRVPPRTYTTPVPTGAGTVGLAGLAVTTTTSNVSVTTLLGLPVLPSTLNAVVNAVSAAVVSAIVNPMVTLLDSLLLGPLTDLLGLNVAGADVFIGPSRPNCTSPVVRG